MVTFGSELLAAAVAGTEAEDVQVGQAAVDALRAAVEATDTNALHAIFGPAGHALVSVDVVEAAEEHELFMNCVKEKVNLVVESDSKQANELGAIQVCRAYVQAQREYASEDRNADEVLEYAQHLRSNPGAHDGLYWSPRTGDELSPLGPLIAQAHSEGYRKQTKILTDEQSPYHGYYFKILTQQGKHAPGGKYNYIINGHMIAGFALVAWPAEWGNTGVMTFIVNQRGKVYQKNLGPKTASTAAAITTYNPDPTWTLTGDQ